MERIFWWIDQLFGSGDTIPTHKKRSRSRRACHKLPLGHRALRIEGLEDRRMLSVSASLVSNVLTVTGDGNDDTITISYSSNNCVVTSQSGVVLSTAASGVHEIYVEAEAGEDTIDLSGVNLTDFVNLTDVDVFGGDDDDTIYGSQDGDFIYGGAGHDTLYGNGGNDWIYGDALPESYYGEDDLFTEPDGLTLWVTVTDDEEQTGPGPYWTPNNSLEIHVQGGNDELYGGDGNDHLIGDYDGELHLYFDTLATIGYMDAHEEFHDPIKKYDVYGLHGGNDQLDGGAGNDVINGEGGNDTYKFAGTASLGTDTILDAGASETLDIVSIVDPEGTDTLDFSGLDFGEGISIDATSNGNYTVVNTGPKSLYLDLFSVGGTLENVIGTQYDDHIFNAEDAMGGTGADIFEDCLNITFDDTTQDEVFINIYSEAAYDSFLNFTADGASAQVQFMDDSIISVTNSDGESTLEVVYFSLFYDRILNKTGEGTLDFTEFQDRDATLTLNVDEGVVNMNADAGSDATLSINANDDTILNFNTTQHLDALYIGEDAVATVTDQTSDLILAVNSLEIADDDASDPMPPGGGYTGSIREYEGLLDLTDNDLIVQDAPAFWVVQDMIRSGIFTSGASGIASETVASGPYAGFTTLGSLFNGYDDDENSGTADVLIYEEFGGETLTSHSIVVKYTWQGDADLDGLVTSVDSGMFSAGYLGGDPNNQAKNPWAYGDFNYDGLVTLADDDLLIDAYNNGGEATQL